MAKPSPKKTIVLRFNKPPRVMTMLDEPNGRAAIRDYIDIPPEVFPIGRLDYDSEGLLLLTNHAPLATRLLHPEYGHRRTYWVQVAGIPDENDLESLRNGSLSVLGRPAKPAEARLLDHEPSFPPRDPPLGLLPTDTTSWIEITLTEGRNRQVRRMTAYIGHHTIRLVRVAIGPLQLGNMQPGEWRHLNQEELDLLWEAVGLEKGS
jgi:23S rRNA pseudouridine2457 synthase